MHKPKSILIQKLDGIIEYNLNKRIQKLYACSYKKEKQCLKVIYRICSHEELSVYFQLEQITDKSIIRIWLYSFEPMEKSNTDNGYVVIPIESLQPAVYVLNNQGAFESIETQIKYDDLNGLADALLEQILIILGEDYD